MIVINSKKYRLSRNEKYSHILNYYNRETCQSGIVTNPISKLMGETLDIYDTLLETISGICEANIYNYAETESERLYQRQFKKIGALIERTFVSTKMKNKGGSCE